MSGRTDLHAALGGPGWQPRGGTLQEDLERLWAPCGIRSEWEPLREVLLHRPGGEIEHLEAPDRALMLEPPDSERARAQHETLADAYHRAGVRVRYVEPESRPPPNLMFVADLLFMTPEGAVVARPAGAARAGEERWVHRALGAIGVPILRTIRGEGTFEGADAIWLAADRVLVAEGVRTNREGAAQVSRTLEELGVSAIPTRLPEGEMHLMGVLRIADRDLAFVREGALPEETVESIADLGYRLQRFPEGPELDRKHAHNFVTLGPRKILMPAGCPHTRRAYEEEGIECIEVAMDEIVKAMGAIGCLTGVLRRG